MGAASEEFLRVCRLTKRFGDEIALAEVAFEIRSGEVLGLIGPNGSGKTTFLNQGSGRCLGREVFRDGCLTLATRNLRL